MRTPLVLAVALLIALPAAAAPPKLDAEAAVPYRWRVLVHFVPNALLTPEFRARLVRDTRAALEPSLGEFAKVEVADLAALPAEARGALATEFLASGWPALESPKFRELTGVKSHFVRVSVADGAVKLEARQHDGSTGLPSPVLRTNQTRDPETVGRLVGLMLGREFGVVGTVEIPEKPRELWNVRLKGGGLAGVEQQVSVGDVFALAVVREQRRPEPTPPPGGRNPATPLPPVRVGQPQEYTLLRAEQPLFGGVVPCRLLTQYAAPFASRPGVVGFRVLKLTTVDADVQVRVVDQTGKPAAGETLVQVRANDVDFLPRTDARDRLELRDGVYRSQRKLRGVACVVVNLGNTREVRYPVPVLDGRPVSLRFTFDAQSDALAAFERRCEDFYGRVRDAATAQNALVKDVGTLITKNKNPEALERVVRGLEALDGQTKALTEELAALKGEPLAVTPAQAALLAATADGLRDLQASRGPLEARAADLRKVVGKVADQVTLEKEFRAKEMTASIRQLLERGEVQEALDTFDELIKLVPLQATKEQRAKIAAEWGTQTPAQAEARKYLLGPWRQASTVGDFTAALVPLTAAVKTLLAADDRLGLRNALTSFDQARAKLHDLADRLSETSENDRAQLVEIQTVAETLRKLEAEARAKVAALEGPK